jgi:hypothetical protein
LEKDNLSAEYRDKFEKQAAEYKERNYHGSTDDFKPELGM